MKQEGILALLLREVTKLEYLSLTWEERPDDHTEPMYLLGYDIVTRMDEEALLGDQIWAELPLVW